MWAWGCPMKETFKDGKWSCVRSILHIGPSALLSIQFPTSWVKHIAVHIMRETQTTEVEATQSLVAQTANSHHVVYNLVRTKLWEWNIFLVSPLQIKNIWAIKPHSLSKYIIKLIQLQIDVIWDPTSLKQLFSHIKKFRIHTENAFMSSGGGHFFD